MKLVMRLVISAAATALAVWLVPGITLTDGDWQQQAMTLLGVALIFGLVNAIIKPIAQFVSGCLIILTFGLFAIVINALMLWLTSWIGGNLGLGFNVAGFIPALWGALIIGVASAIGNTVTGANRDDHH